MEGSVRGTVETRETTELMQKVWWWLCCPAHAPLSPSPTPGQPGSSSSETPATSSTTPRDERSVYERVFENVVSVRAHAAAASPFA